MNQEEAEVKKKPWRERKSNKVEKEREKERERTLHAAVYYSSSVSQRQAFESRPGICQVMAIKLVTLDKHVAQPSDEDPA